MEELRAKSLALKTHLMDALMRNLDNVIDDMKITDSTED
jgi:hypothetical protein